MNKIKLSISVAVIMFMIARAGNVSAFECFGTLSTGLNSTAGTSITGVVVAAPPAAASSSSSGGGGGGGTAITVNKTEPQVMGASTEKIATTEGAEKPISQMTRAEKLEKIAEIRLLLIQLIQQLIAELQKQLLATGK
ncbi:MAG: hypothetical protein YFSK_1640 [Candidatus Yanofskyibacterium parasiticum]|jgi:hypothetical protein|nr:MAG: hypothetical protein YFSK_1640 [Candidatus Yanofskybacteria bacterium]